MDATSESTPPPRSRAKKPTLPPASAARIDLDLAAALALVLRDPRVRAALVEILLPLLLQALAQRDKESQEHWLSRKEAAAYCGMTYTAFKKRVLSDAMLSQKGKGTPKRWKPKDLDAWMEQGT